MHKLVASIAILFSLLITGESESNILRVPSAYETIQSAFDASNDRDTVVVDTGNFPESLLAPPHMVNLVGSTQDQGDTVIRTVVNPASIPGSDTLSCMILPNESSIFIQDIVFVNGPEMYPHDPDASGGIVYFTSDSIRIADCVFDSVLRAIDRGNLDCRPKILVEGCRFSDCVVRCINARGPAIIRDCLFDGYMGSGVSVLDSSRIENCHFTGYVQTNWIGAYRQDNVIIGNTFGPGVHEWDALEVYSRGGNDSILNNSFNCSTVLSSGRVLNITVSEGFPVYCADNDITDTTLGPTGLPLDFSDDEFGSEGMRLIFESNRVHDLPLTENLKAIHVRTNYSGLIMSDSRFENLQGTAESIRLDSNSFRHILRENFFHRTGNAVYNASGFTLDARRNWWGHETGPYHAELNPSGQGDTLNSPGPIVFDPWLIDTSLWSSTMVEPSGFPTEYRLSAFPNPTNAAVTISLISRRQTEIGLKLYNILGREVRTLWEGKIEGFEYWNIDLADEATGVYFICAQNSDNVLLAAQRIVLLK